MNYLLTDETIAITHFFLNDIKLNLLCHFIFWSVQHPSIQVIPRLSGDFLLSVKAILTNNFNFICQFQF